MSEARALRDRLEETQVELRRTREHLDKLRAHQLREQQASRQELESARREVTQLRQRLEELERGTLSAGELARVETVLAVPVAATSTALVALVKRPASLEKDVATLSRVLRLPPVDVRIRLTAPPPIVVARVPVGEVAALREALRAEGLASVSKEVPPRVAGGMMTVRRFTLEEQTMALTGTKGERQRVLYSELRLLMRGRRITTEMETRPFWETDLPTNTVDLGAREMKREHHGQFLWAFGEGVRVAFSHETVFLGLGGQMGLSRHDSLQRLTEALRQRAPHVVFDERFMKAPSFTLPMVEQDRGQELLADLIDQAILEGQWP